VDIEDDFPVRVSAPVAPFGFSDVIHTLLDRDRFTGDSDFNYFISYGMIFIITFISWVACGLWIARRFGGGIFLACSTLAILTGIPILLAGPSGRDVIASLFTSSGIDAIFLSVRSRDTNISELWGISSLIFFGVFVIGLLVRRYRLYLLVTGYIGMIVGSSGFITSIIAVNYQDFPHFCLLLSVVLMALVLIETGMRRSMFNFLNEPQ
jgi:hypothetical protein